MKKVLRAVLLLSLFLPFIPTAALQAILLSPNNPWFSEIIDSHDIEVREEISTSWLPGFNTLAIACAGVSEAPGCRIHKIALQVSENTGSLPFKPWKCTSVLNVGDHSGTGGLAASDVCDGRLVRLIYNFLAYTSCTYKLRIIRQEVYQEKLPQIRSLTAKPDSLARPGIRTALPCS